MTRYLLATRSVHLTAVAGDYLATRLTAGDAVVMVTVDDGSNPRLAATH